MPSSRPRPPHSIHPQLVPWFMDHMRSIIERNEIEKAYKVPDLVPPRGDSEKVPTGYVGQLPGLLNRYDAHRHEGYTSQHSTYRGLIDAIKAFCEWVEPIRKTVQVLEKDNQEKINSSIDQIEHLICELAGANRGFLEDPVILGYYRASTVFQNDQFFTKLGQALKRRTAPHASSKQQEALWIEAQEEAGVPFEKRARLDGTVATPGADRKILKRYGSGTRSAKR